MVGKKEKIFFHSAAETFLEEEVGWCDVRNVAICQTPPGRKKTRFPGLTKPEIFLSAMFDFFFAGLRKGSAVAVKGSDLGLGLSFVPNPCTYICVLSTNGATRINIMYKFFFLPPYAAAGN